MVWSELTAAGWKLAKAAAVAGATVTAAPMILPPLVIVSALGLAFSLPSTILVAGYVCNEKLMTSLLSTPTPTDQPDAQPELYLMYEEEEGKEEEVEEKKKDSEEDEKVVLLATKGQDGYDEVIRISGSVEGSSIQEGDSRKEEEYESLSDKVLTLERKTLGDRMDETDMGGTLEKHKYGNDQDTTPSPKLQEVVTVEEQAIVVREVLEDEYKVDLSSHTFGSQLQHVHGDGEEGVEVPVDHVAHSSITAELKTSMEVLIEPADNLAAKSPGNEVQAATLLVEFIYQIIRFLLS